METSNLRLVRGMEALPFEALMDIYVESNLENARSFWPDAPEETLLPRAKESFRQYLEEDFFHQPEAVYALWQADGAYVSALRLFRFRGELLLEALETRPDRRRRGYAAALIRAVLESLEEQGPVKVYSHVRKTNAASLRTHAACGFRHCLDWAEYGDGTRDEREVTLVYSSEA